EKIKAGAVTTVKLDAEAVTAAKIEVGTLSAREMAFSENLYTNDVELPSGAELFDLNQPDCVSSDGRVPTDKEIVYFPGKVSENQVPNVHDNPHSKFAGRGVIGMFKATTNLVTDPEDLTTGNWTNINSTDELSDFYIGGKRFTKVINSGANTGYVYQNFTATWTTLTPAFSVTVRKGIVLETQHIFW
ncbi:hypothetical protein LCGC14_3078330, partial [marine sediment metagenome]